MHFVFAYGAVLYREGFFFLGWGGFSHFSSSPSVCLLCRQKSVTLAFFFVVSKSLSPYNTTFTYTVVRFVARGRRRRRQKNELRGPRGRYLGRARPDRALGRLGAGAKPGRKTNDDDDDDDGAKEKSRTVESDLDWTIRETPRRRCERARL